jgi:hypothetical protein
MYHYFSVLGSSAYPKILGLPVSNIEKKTWGNGLWAMLKFAIHKKSILEQFFICLVISLLIYLYSTMCFGIYSAVCKKEFLKILVFVSVIIYFVLVSSGVVADIHGYMAINARYRVPIMPYVVLLSCYGMTVLRNRFKKSKQ